MRNILSFKEKLTQQLSGDQIEEVLDTFLINALAPILKTTYFIEDCLAEMLALVIDNRRRKISSFPNDELSAKVFSLIVANDYEIKLEILKDIQLERSILFHILKKFYDLSEPHMQALPTVAKGTGKTKYFNAIRESAEVLREFRFKQEKDKSSQLYYTVKQSKYYSDLAYTFRSMVVEKYVRFVFNRAMKYAKSTKLNISAKDLFKDLIISTFKAVDKYRSSSGTLTVHVGWWIKDGVTQSSTQHEYGIAYHIPAARRRAMIATGKQVSNFSYEINDKIADNVGEDLLEESVIKSDSEFKFIRVAARADKNRVAFLDLGLYYPLDAEEIALLKGTMLCPPKQELCATH